MSPETCTLALPLAPNRQPEEIILLSYCLHSATHKDLGSHPRYLGHFCCAINSTYQSGIYSGCPGFFLVETCSFIGLATTHQCIKVSTQNSSQVSLGPMHALSLR